MLAEARSCADDWKESAKRGRAILKTSRKLSFQRLTTDFPTQDGRNAGENTRHVFHGPRPFFRRRAGKLHTVSGSPGISARFCRQMSNWCVLKDEEMKLVCYWTFVGLKCLTFLRGCIWLVYYVYYVYCKILIDEIYTTRIHLLSIIFQK